MSSHASNPSAHISGSPALDPRATLANTDFAGSSRSTLYVHLDVLTNMEKQGDTRLRRRLGLVLQHLAAYGRTTTVKGVRGNDNQGWRRSPLGGNGGNQFYLWWAPQGAAHVSHLPLQPNQVIVRAVRHHDDHTPLLPGPLDDYVSVNPREFADDATDDGRLIPAPWTPAQLQFVDSDRPVRVLMGSPGSGKTSALYRAVETRAAQRVLYVTWSRELADQARRRFHTFANDSLDIVTQDYPSMLAEINQRDHHALTLRDSQQAFYRRAAQFGVENFDAWGGKQDKLRGLHAELRAYLFGRAVVGAEGVLDSFPVARLSTKAYMHLRGSRSGVGHQAATQLVHLLELSHSKELRFAEVFPELAAATRSVKLLRENHHVPAGYEHLDRIVMDEVQDLTLLEFSVIIELIRAVARQRGTAPHVLIAGDDAQTVRPSGFEWGPYNALLTRQVRTLDKFTLEENVRSPQGIVDVVSAALDMYGSLDKAYRPTKQRYIAADPDRKGTVFRLSVPSVEGGKALLDGIVELSGVAVISPTGQPPEWLPEEHRSAVVTPAQVKGLEYQAVCVLDPGSLIAELDAMTTDETRIKSQQQQLRTNLDQLRVALSRATETLALVDFVGDPDQAHEVLRATDKLCGNVAREVSAGDLVAFLSSGSLAPAEQRAQRWMDEAYTFMDERPDTAWLRAKQAVKLAVDAVNSDEPWPQPVREQVLGRFMGIAARLLIDGLPQGVSLPSLLQHVRTSLDRIGRTNDRRAFEALSDWTQSTAKPPFDLLDATLALGQNGGWMAGALTSVRQTIKQSLTTLAEESEHAAGFGRDVEGWLELLGYPGDVAEQARALRIRAAVSLLENGKDRKLAHIDEVLSRIEPEEPGLTGRVREQQKRFEQAAQAFERAENRESALKNWRNAGRWAEALRLAQGQAKEDLGWLVSLQSAITARPHGQAKRMTEAERKALRDLIKLLE